MAASRDIDTQIRQAKETQQTTVKLLLLGTGESGKSTIVKQMKILHQKGYTEAELDAYVEIVYGNILQSIKALEGAMEQFQYQYDSPANAEIAAELAEIATQTGVTVAHGEKIKRFWSDSGIQKAFARSSEYWLPDSTEYYMNNLTRIFAVGYRPTEADVLHSRVRTTGIVETEFQYRELTFKLADVGGQRNERKKWIHCFQDVTAVLFLVGVSEYDQTLFEDDTENRLTESLTLFNEICNSKWFTDTSMILFLNKIDIFRYKIEEKKVPITVCFADYAGENTYEACLDFIQKQFIALNKNPNKAVYPYLTQATNTENVKFVFEAIKDTLLASTLRTTGFIP
jgi:GTPase SAR1 family protein